MSKPVSFRLSDVHAALLDRLVEFMTAEGMRVTKTDVVERAIYEYAGGWLSDAERYDIVDKYYEGILNLETDINVAEILRKRDQTSSDD